MTGEQSRLFPEPPLPKPAKKVKQKRDASMFRNWGGWFPHPQLDPPREENCESNLQQTNMPLW